MSESSRPSTLTSDEQRGKAVWSGVEPRRNFLSRIAAGLALVAVPTVATVKAAGATQTTTGPFGPAAREAFNALGASGQVMVLSMLASCREDGSRPTSELFNTDAQRAWWKAHHAANDERRRIEREHNEQTAPLVEEARRLQAEINNCYKLSNGTRTDRRRLRQLRKAEKPLYARMRALTGERDRAIAAIVRPE